MLRNVISCCSSRRIYTCLFVPMKTRHPPTYHVATTQQFHTTADQRKRETILSERAAVKNTDLRFDKLDNIKEFRFTALDKDNFDAAFPTEETPDMIIQGTRFKDLPVVYIKASANNIIITLATADGRTIKTASGGTVGFKNKRESSPVAAQIATVAIAKEAKKEGMYAVRVALKGIGTAREDSLKALITAGLSVVSISDITPLPFNGNRPPKKRSM